MTPEKNVLVVYNKSSEESTKIKDYYILNRPGFSNVNVLGIDFPNAQERAEESDFDTNVRRPIFDWIRAHTDKSIDDIVLVRGIPPRVGPSDSNQWKARAGSKLAQTYTDYKVCDKDPLPSYYNFGAQTPGTYCDRVSTGNSALKQPSQSYIFSPKTHVATMAVTSYLDMGSLDATLHYIDKLKTMYNAMPNPSVFISASGTGKGGSTYYIDDTIKKGSWADTSKLPSQGILKKDLLLLNNPSTKIDYRPLGGTYLTSAKDVLGFSSWGANGCAVNPCGDYAVDGSIKFSGNSNWYIIQTIESHNGQIGGDGWQGDYTKWFSANAFGGTNYSNTPVGAVAHVDEPTLNGVNGPVFFECWDSGQLLIDCGWMSRNAMQDMVVGDPWVRK
jgi:hypothetical protein